MEPLASFTTKASKPASNALLTGMIQISYLSYSIGKLPTFLKKKYEKNVPCEFTLSAFFSCGIHGNPCDTPFDPVFFMVMTLKCGFAIVAIVIRVKSAWLDILF